MSAIVFGSLNMDLVSRVPRLPSPGETILGDRFDTTPGGKGANQAVALARLGILTQMVGRVGNDDFGRSLIQSLTHQNIATDHILSDPHSHSGVALITVSEQGENQIIGIFGANGQIDDSDVQRLLPLFPQAQLLLMQLEIPIAAVQAAAQAAKTAGITVILDPAPVQSPDLSAIYPYIDWLLPNQVEAGQLVGFTVVDRATAAKAATQLQAQGVPNVIVKLGEQGAWCQTPTASHFVPAFPVAAVDTVACGDAFAAGFSAALLANLPIPTALRWASAAGALAATQQGAQMAMPDRASLEDFLRSH